MGAVATYGEYNGKPDYNEIFVDLPAGKNKRLLL